MPMPSCYLSFLLCFGGRSIFLQWSQNYELTCVSKSFNYDNYVFKFYLWMPRGGMDTFPLVVNYLNAS
jgi:hypothetical protein